MRNSSLLRLSALALPLSIAATGVARAQSVDSRALSALTWRNLGPFRAGRVAAVTGSLADAGTFYIGLPAAGVWKTTNAGATWYPIFDAVKDVSSIGSVEVAPSDPNIVYTGTGDIITGGGINEGNGVYKSTDAGRTWRHLGLDATKQIPSMLVGVNDPNLVLVAAQGNVHVKSKDRGVFRSTDGGSTWTQTLFVDDSTGAQRFGRAFDTPNTIFVTTVLHYTPPVPAGRGGGPGAGTGPTSSKIFKSTDGGVTWHEITGNGLPARLTGKMWVTVANHTNGQRVFIIGDWGLYRSDDGGATWKQMAADDQRIRNGQGGYNCGVYSDPNDPNTVYTLNTASYVSHDGGATFTGFKGAPGGDDPQQMWIDPTNGKRILFGYDQGAIVSLDAGATWSSWYNQSTEQIYHLSVDNSFPYWVYGTQQDAGAIRTRSRGNLGAITPLDWNPVSGWEWGTIIPDPLDNNTIYASGSGILKISYPSEQWINVSPSEDASKQLRTTSDQPIRFAPWDKHLLIAGFQSVWTTSDGGLHWKPISGDLAARPSTNGAPPNGAIQSMSASTAKAGLIWVGTNTGRVWVTTDGGVKWTESMLPSLPNIERAEIFSVEASHFDPATAYVVVDMHRVGDYAPHVYRTHDYGKTWTSIVTGMATDQPSGSFARFVRNDTQKKGLLFGGTESSLCVSFDDGDHWQQMTGGLTNTSYRDGVVKDNDWVITTYGRGLFVLDDVSALRQMSAAVTSEDAHLFKPGEAYRVRRNVGADTPFPPEVPHALNPAEGAQVDYWLARMPSGDISLDVYDASGARIRHMSSLAATAVPEAARPPHPNFWVAPPFALTKNAGGNRTHWDLRHDAPAAFGHSFEINANPGLTPASPIGPLVAPGTYTLKLTVEGKTYAQTVVVKNDPRSPATAAALTAQHALQAKILAGANFAYEAHELATALGTPLRGDTTARVASFLARLDSLTGLDAGRRGGRTPGQQPRPTFRAINGAFVQQLNTQENGDMAPNAAALAQFATTCKELQTVTSAWQKLTTIDLGEVNAIMKTRGRPTLVVGNMAFKAPACM